MKYNIASVIERLKKAQDKGATIIDEAELLKIAAPQINDIDRQLRLIECGIRKLSKKIGNKQGMDTDFNYRVTFTEAENLTGIPRRTFYRWDKEAMFIHFVHKPINLIELKTNLLRIKEIKGKMSQIETAINS